MYIHFCVLPNLKLHHQSLTHSMYVCLSGAGTVFILCALYSCSLHIQHAVAVCLTHTTAPGGITTIFSSVAQVLLYADLIQAWFK